MQKAIFVAGLVIGAALIYWWSTMNKAEGFQGQGQGQGNGYTFVMYGVDWCPHCVKAKPEFAALGATKTIGGAQVTCMAVDPEKEPEKVKGKVEGYPTFHLYDAQGSLAKEYNGPRTTAGFEAFLKDAVIVPA